MNNQQFIHEPSRQYRQQYVNENSIPPSRQTSYVDSISSFDIRSISTAQTSLLSNFSFRSLPDVEVSSTPIHSISPMQGGSILVHNYYQQKGQTSYLS